MESPSTSTADILNIRQLLALIIKTQLQCNSVEPKHITQRSLRSRQARSLILDDLMALPRGDSSSAKGTQGRPRSSTDQKLPGQHRRGGRGTASYRGGRGSLWGHAVPKDMQRLKRHLGGDAGAVLRGCSLGHREVTLPPLSPGCMRTSGLSVNRGPPCTESRASGFLTTTRLRIEIASST